MADLFGHQLFEAIVEMRQKELFEDSIRKNKKKSRGEIYDVLHNKLGKFIKTFVIITAENPKGVKLKPHENKIRMNELSKTLKERRIIYLKQLGVYGNEENSLILINANLEDAKYIGLKFEHESFIYCECKNNKITSCYYEAKDDYSSYYLKQEITKPIEEIEDADDFYSMYKFNNKNKIKYAIPFSLFEDVADFIAESMNISLNENDVRLSEESIRIAAFGCGSSRYYRNMTMYKAIQENIKRHLQGERSVVE